MNLEVVEIKTKKCGKCKIYKDLNQFHQRLRNPDGLLEICKICKKEYDIKYRSKNADRLRERQRNWYKENTEKVKNNTKVYKEKNPTKVRENKYFNNLFLNYGLSKEKYLDILECQGACCAICKSSTANSKISERLFVDHCHETGEVRGLLCHGCNVGIGLLKEKIENLYSAINYLKKYNDKQRTNNISIK
jgi:hypothetical protein